MTIAEILALLKNPNATAAQLRDGVAAADAAIKAGDEAVQRLEVKRQELLLQDDADDQIENLDKEAGALDRDGERCIAAKAKLLLLITDAEARELDADLKAKGRRTAKIAKDLTEQMLRWDKAQAEVGEAAARIQALNSELGILRKFLHEHGRRDLVALSPFAKLQDLGVHPVHMPNFDAPVPNGYHPPADNFVSRPLLRLRYHDDKAAGAGLIDRVKAFIK